jgi:hypothetical protein
MIGVLLEECWDGLARRLFLRKSRSMAIIVSRRTFVNLAEDDEKAVPILAASECQPT